VVADVTAGVGVVSTRSLRLIGQGREAEIFEWSDGRALKLLRARGSNAGLASEIAALNAARSAGVAVPRTYEEVTIDGRSGLVMDRLEGADLLTIIGQKPWRVFHSGRLTGEVHARINAALAPAGARPPTSQNAEFARTLTARLSVSSTSST
jgi:Ser/Thr protein kinase RdoA (MazF antagonist)